MNMVNGSWPVKANVTTIAYSFIHSLNYNAISFSLQWKEVGPHTTKFYECSYGFIDGSSSWSYVGYICAVENIIFDGEASEKFGPKT